MATLGRSKEDWQVTKGSVKERFKELLTLSQWTDCTFAVGEEEEIIRCHKLVLAVSSPVFEALFFGCLANPDEIIRVPDMDPYIFKLLLGYIYSDTLDLRCVEEAGGLLYAGKKYLMPQLSRLCIDYLIENTCIKTLWEVLPVAEALDEEQLISPCLKVLCRHPPYIWMEEGRRLNRKTMRLLVEQRGMNMSEKELWLFLVDWARGEGVGGCHDPLRLRSTLSDFLPFIRFMNLSPDEVAEEVAPTRVFSEREVEALGAAVQASDPKLLPPELSQSTEKRLKIAQLTWVCSREVVLHGRVWTYGGLVGSRFSSRSQVLLTGFEVFTRAATPPSTSSPPTGVYRERLALFLKDPQGNVLAKTDHDAMVQFNSLQVVTLPRPVWILPSTTYTALFELPFGQYPLVSFSETTFAKGTTFTFSDSLEPLINSNVSFINSILYAL